MSRYKKGDVVRVDFPYWNKKTGRLESKRRPFVVIDVADETDNITVSCTSQLQQSKNYKGIIVLGNSDVGKKMGINEDSLIYCHETITLSNKEIMKRIGTCPIIEDIIKLVNS